MQMCHSLRCRHLISRPELESGRALRRIGIVTGKHDSETRIDLCLGEQRFGKVGHFSRVFQKMSESYNTNNSPPSSSN